MNAKEQYYYEVAGDIPEEYDYLEKIRAERHRLQEDCEKIIEAMYAGVQPSSPKPYTLGYVKLRCDANHFAEMYYEELKPYAEALDAFLTGDAMPLMRYVHQTMLTNLARKSNYRAYNITALAKRHRKNAGQQEIDRVQALIDEGAKEIEYLTPRKEWLEEQLRKVSTMTEDQAKGMTEHADFWCSYESVKKAFEFLEDRLGRSEEEDRKAIQGAHRLLVMWGDKRR